MITEVFLCPEKVEFPGFFDFCFFGFETGRLLYTGMRCGEMIALRWRDVVGEHGLLTIEKNASMEKNHFPRKDYKKIQQKDKMCPCDLL